LRMKQGANPLLADLGALRLSRGILFLPEKAWFHKNL
jgi:hypothetical protein